MAYIKKLKDNELIGGTDNTDVYPVTSTEAVYNRDNVSQEYINNHVDGSKIVDGTVANPKIANGAVSMNKLDNETQTLIQRGADSSWTPKGDFNIETTYDANDVVFDSVTNSSYLSLRADNTGHPVDENDEEYEEGWWMKVLDGSYVNRAIEEMEAAIAQAIEDAQEDISELISDSQATINAAVSGANSAAQAANTAASNAEAKIDWVEEQVDSLTAYEVATELDEESIIPVQNKVIAPILSHKQNVTCYYNGYYNGLAKSSCSVGATFSMSLAGSSNWFHQKVDVKEGEVYYITATGSSGCYSYAFIDSNGIVKRVGSQNANNKKVVIQNGEVALMMSGVQTNSFSVIKEGNLYELTTEKDTDLQQQINSLANFVEVYRHSDDCGNRFFVYRGTILSVRFYAYNETATSSVFTVYQDGKAIYAKTAVSGECPRWCYLDGDILYFASVIRANLLDSGTSTQDTIKLFTLDLTTFTWTQVGSAMTRDMIDRPRYHYTFVSFCKFNNAIYAAMSNMNAGRGINQKIEFYSVGEEGFTFVSNIATNNERWGKGTSSNIYLNYQCPAYGTLSTDGSYIYCRYIAEYNLVLLKRTSDFITWEKYEQLGAVGFRLNGTLGDAYLPLSTPLYYGYWSNDQYGVCTNEKDEYKYLNITQLIQFLSGSTTITDRMLFADGGYLYIYGKYVINGGFRYSIWRCKNTELYAMMCGKSISEIYTNNINDVPFGSAAIMTKSGSTGLYKYHSTIQVDVARVGAASEYITIPEKGIVKVMNLGTELGYYPWTINDGNDMVRSVFLHNMPFHNDFQSNYFRSPNVCQSLDGKIIHGLGTARYVTLGDATLMEPIYGRSFDGGRTWVDRRVLVERPTGGSYIAGVRVTGLFFISDTNENSPYYGRIYTMGTIVNNTNNTDFIADMQVIILHTDDNGTTWHGAWDNSDAEGSYLDITSQLVPENWEELGWKRFNLSDNQGKTFVGGTMNGMLYASMWVDYNNVGTPDYRPALIYSVDNGMTWHLGAIAASGNESAIVQMDDHTLLMNTRPNNTAVSRRQFYKMDLSNGVENAVWEAAPEVISGTQVTQEGWAKINDVYLISRPTGTDSQGYLKSKITLFKSRDLVHWEKIITLTPLGIRYSNAYVIAISYSNILVSKEHLGVMLETKEANIEYYNLDYLLPYVLS